MAIHVDDFIILTLQRKVAEEFNALFRKYFKATEATELGYNLGVVIKHDPKIISYYTPQKIQALLPKNWRRGTSKSCNPLKQRMKPSEPSPYQFKNITLFQSVVGSLLWISGQSRPDISFATNMVARKMASPSTDDYVNVKNIVDYLGNTEEFQLTYNKDVQKVRLVCHADADWAGAEDYKSTSGYCCFLEGVGIIQWKSKRQSTVATSSAESEFISLSMASQVVMMLREILRFLGFEQETTPIYWDNTSAVSLVTAQAQVQRTKHFNVRYFYVRHLALINEISVLRVTSKENAADSLTKPLTGTPLIESRKLLFLRNFGEEPKKQKVREKEEC